MITKIIVVFFSIIVLSLSVSFSAGNDGNSDRRSSMHSYVPEEGFVPDEKTAIAIAEAVLVPIYGKDSIERQKPFIVNLSDNVWTITGSLPKDSLGGVFFIRISKQDARVITLTHSK